MNNKIKKSGFSIIEIVLAVSLFALIALTSISSALYGENAQVNSGQRKRASLLSDQTIEILRAVRDSSSQGFSALSNGTYGLDRDWNGAWILVPDAPDTVDNFLRTVTISSIDDFTKEISTSICWPYTNCPSSGDSVALDTYLTNWRGTDGTPGGIKVAISGEGHAYMITTDNTLEVYDVSAPTSTVKVGTVTLAGDTGTLPNNLFYTAGKIYIASDDPSAELQIVDVSSPASPQDISTLNIAVDGDTDSSGDGIWASSAGEIFLSAHNSDNTKSQFFMIDGRDINNPIVLENGDIYTTTGAQTSGDLSVGQLSSVDSMCNTSGGVGGETGYVLHCYHYNFDFASATPTPTFSGTLSDADTDLSPSRTVLISGGNYFTTPGGKISKNSSTPVSISDNDIYDISVATRSGRLYAYLSVVGDTASGLKEVDINSIGDPIMVSAQNTDGTLSGAMYDSSVSPKYIFGANRTGASLGFVSFAPTPVGIHMTPFDDITATTSFRASIVHCEPTVAPDDDHGCPQVYILTNVTAAPIDYTLSASEDWVVFSTATSSTLSAGASATTSVSVDVDELIAEDVDEGTHTATVHLMYLDSDENPADITRTVTLYINAATGIKIQ